QRRITSHQKLRHKTVSLLISVRISSSRPIACPFSANTFSPSKSSACICCFVITPPEFVQSLSFATTTPTPAPVSSPPRHPHAPRSVRRAACPTESGMVRIRCVVFPKNDQSHCPDDCSNDSAASSHPAQRTPRAAVAQARPQALF